MTDKKLILNDHFNPPELTNVHDALNEAVFESKENWPMVNFSVRLKEKTKLSAMEICKLNGTDLSTYLRKCTDVLVRDYQGTQE